MKRNFFIVLILFLLFSFVSCKTEDNAENQPTSFKIYGRITDTFSGKPISGVDVKVKVRNGGEYETESDENGNYELTVDRNGIESQSFLLKVYYNFSRGKSDYIPSVLTRSGEENDEASSYFLIREDTKIDMDLVKKYDIFLKDTIKDLEEEYSMDEDDAIVDIIYSYRGRNRLGTNQVWVKKPEQWVVYDPRGILKQYSDPKHNEVFNNIMQGFKAIQEYTDGFIKAPSRDKVEIKYETIHWVDNGIFFEITDGEAWAADDENDYDEIIRSGAGANPKFNYGSTVIAELVSSIQGGDNESNCPSVFVNGNMSELDRIWGKFNYKKREPGNRMISPHWTDRNPYGFLFETRSWDEIVRLGRN